jgi:serpin B
MIDAPARPLLTRRTVLGLLGAALAPPATVPASGPAPGDDRAALVAGTIGFGFDLYAKLPATRGNVFFSPYSVTSALAMTYAGARGATAAEMARTLRFALPPDRLHLAFAGLVREINGTAKKRASELRTASALWSQKGHPFVPDFQRTARDSYEATLEEVDFRKAPETARRTINAWVERQTYDRIKDLMPEGTLDQETVLVLTNAIYFKGTWARAFDAEATKPGDFMTGATGAVRRVPLMRQRETHRYLDGDTFQALELPYDARETSMTVFLPRRVDGLAEFEGTLSAARVTEWLGRMTPHHVDVTLPRFTLTASADLNGPLSALGMPLAFSRQRADFSGMVRAQRVSISTVQHKAYVDVTEKGTEAAAATGVGMRLTSAAPPPAPPAVFRADHPFFFVIRDHRTDSILFAGRLTDPPAA